jgi:hypothetical protein
MNFLDRLVDFLTPDTFLYWSATPVEVGMIEYCRGYTETTAPGLFRVTRCVEVKDDEMETYNIFGKRI